MHEIGQSAGFLGRILESLLKFAFLLIKNVLKTLAKIVLIPLGLTAVTSARDATIKKKIFGLGVTGLIISNEDMDYIMKISRKICFIVKSLSKTIKNKAKEQKGGFIWILLGTLGASLLGNLSTGKGVKAEIPGRGELEQVREELELVKV